MFKKIKFRELWNLEILPSKKISECIGKHNIIYSGTMHPTNSTRDRSIVSYIKITGDIKSDNSSFENLFKIIERNMEIYYKQKTDLSKEQFKIEIKEKGKFTGVILHGRQNYQFTILLETSQIINSSDEFDNPLKDNGFEKEEPTKKPFGFKILDYLFGLGGAIDVIRLQDLPLLNFKKLKGGNQLKNLNSYRTKLSYVNLIFKVKPKKEKVLSFKLEGNVNKNNESLHSLIAEINKEILKVIPNSQPLKIEFSVLKLKSIDRAIYFTIKAIEYPIIIEFAIHTVYTPLPITPKFKE